MPNQSVALPIHNHSQLMGLETATPANDTSVLHTGIQHIGFKLAKEELLLSMELVKEIIMLPTITYVPHSNDAIEGIFSLRGEIMPVFNLRRIMDLTRGEAHATTRVIILQCVEGGLGAIVDEITEFVWIEESEAETLDQNVFGPQYHFLAGVSKVGDKMRGILDVKKLIAKFSAAIEVETL